MKWSTEVRKLSELKKWESNPRTISDERFDELISSVDELGNFEPLVIDTDGTVIAGNQRLRVSQKLGETEVEVSVPERKLTEEEIKKIGIISNKHSGEWDMDKLANEFEDVLNEMGFDDLLDLEVLDKKEVTLKPIKKFHILLSVGIEGAEGLQGKIETLDLDDVEVYTSGN